MELLLSRVPHDPSHRRALQAEMLGDLLERVDACGVGLLDGTAAIRRTLRIHYSGQSR